jgi:hypothetical protein
MTLPRRLTPLTYIFAFLFVFFIVVTSLLYTWTARRIGSAVLILARVGLELYQRIRSASR